jgi:isoleucyl-tRNA synthetase
VLDADASLKAAIGRFDHVLQENVLLANVRYAKEEGMEHVALGDKSLGLKIE